MVCSSRLCRLYSKFITRIARSFKFVLSYILSSFCLYRWKSPQVSIVFRSCPFTILRVSASSRRSILLCTAFTRIETNANRPLRILKGERLLYVYCIHCWSFRPVLLQRWVFTGCNYYIDAIRVHVYTSNI